MSERRELTEEEKTIILRIVKARHFLKRFVGDLMHLTYLALYSSSAAKNSILFRYAILELKENCGISYNIYSGYDDLRPIFRPTFNISTVGGILIDPLTADLNISAHIIPPISKFVGLEAPIDVAGIFVGNRDLIETLWHNVEVLAEMAQKNQRPYIGAIKNFAKAVEEAYNVMLPMTSTFFDAILKRTDEFLDSYQDDLADRIIRVYIYIYSEHESKSVWIQITRGEDVHVERWKLHEYYDGYFLDCLRAIYQMYALVMNIDFFLDYLDLLSTALETSGW